MDYSTRSGLIEAASGQAKADLIIKDARVLDVFTNEITRGNVAVYGGYVAGVGGYTDAERTIDAGGRYLVPGFINAHCHVESSMVSPAHYCAEELRWGVTTLITDPHETANVAGTDGIRFMLACASEMPVNYYVMLPSCVPATKYESSGAVLKAEQLRPLLGEPGILGLGEMMDYAGVLRREPDILDKLDAAEGYVIDGHAPGLTWRELCGYAAAGIATDHECTGFMEAKDKLRAGMAVLVREGSSCENLADIISGVVAERIKTEFMAFCTDDKHLSDIRREGTIRHCVQKAISLGLPPAEAYCMASINAARIYKLTDIGAIAPGYRADMVLLDDLNSVSISRVFKDGREVRGLDADCRPAARHHSLENSVRLPHLDGSSFALPAPTKDCYPVIGLIGGQILTRRSYIPASDLQRAVDSGEICKAAVIERHRASGNIGVGLLSGYGLKSGAVASTVGHDSHNLIIAGTDDEDMLKAAGELERMHGGFVFVQGGLVKAALPLPIFGLMSEKSTDELIPALEDMLSVLREAGVREDIDPLITLSFLALPVIPEIRLTDKGVFDVTASRFI